jgi:hypothetical protein
MMRAWFLALAAGAWLPAAAPAQAAAWQFRSQPGQVLTYRVEQITSATEEVGGNKTVTTTRLNLVKRWQDLGPVQGQPGTRFSLSLASLRIETTRASGEVLLFDSANPEKSDPGMREQLTRLIGQPLAVIRLDPSGKVIEVLDCKHGPATRFESEPPFTLVLPGAAPQAGQGWERTYQITLAPPQGAGEKFDATQKYMCQAIKDGKATVALTTLIKNLPASLLDQVPLLQAQPQGEVVFDVQAGRMESTQLRIDKELINHQGEGSRYRFESLYTEQFVGGK